MVFDFYTLHVTLYKKIPAVSEFLPYFPILTFEYTQNAILSAHLIRHRGQKLDGAIGQGEICNSLKSENFSKSFLSHFGKNKIKF